MNDAPKLRDEVVQKYLIRMGEKIARMRTLLQAPAWDDLRVECHRLKGSGASYGFPELSELGAQAEKQILEKSEQASQAVVDLLAAMEKILFEHRERKQS